MISEASGLPEEPQDVGSLLRTHRERLGLTGGALAERLGLSQAKVSRIETGRTAATEPDVRLISQALGLSAEETDRLATMARQSRVAPARGARRRPGKGGIAGKQAEVGHAELASREIRVFQPTVVTGLLQTSGYAEGIMRSPLRLAGLTGTGESEAALLDAVAGRLRRQQILKLPDKRFFFVMTESVLANRLVSPEDMLAQIRRIREIARQDNVSIRFIPADAALIDPPLHSFELLDDESVMIDLYHTLVTSHAPADIEIYQDIFTMMTQASVAEIDEILDRAVAVYLAALNKR